jgi:hypothetical protein
MIRRLFILACIVSVFSAPGYSQGLDVTKFPGTDIGQQVNAAYAALPPTGGKLHVPSKPDGSCYQYATPIVINIPNKSVVIEGDSLQSTCLQFLGTGVAAQFDYGFNHVVFGAALRDLSLQGTAQQGTGLVLGGSNGAEGLLVENVRITGFGLGVTYSQHAWASRFAHAIIDDNVQNLYYPPGLIASGENTEFNHVLFLNSNSPVLNTDANVANSIVINAGAGSPPDFNFVDCSFDGVQLVLTVGYVNFVNPHFEGGFGRNALDWIVINGAYVNIVNPMFLQDFFSGIQPSQLIRATAGLTVLSGVKAYTNQVIPRFMLLQGSANALVLGEINVQNFAADVVKDAGATGYFAIHGDYGSSRPLRFSNNTGVWWENTEGIPTEIFRVDAYNGLIIQNPGGNINFWNKGESSVIGDFNDNGLAIGAASISTSGNANFRSVTTANQRAASVEPGPQVVSANAQHEVRNSLTRFNSIISFGIIPANTCKENGIPVAGATTNTSVAPVWPPLENGLTGIMYIQETGKVMVRLCNSTASAVGTAGRYFGGRLDN